MPTLTTPANPAPGTVVNVTGNGFQNYKTRLLLDGVGATTNIFRPRKDGTFQVGITVSSTPKTQILVAEQNTSGSKWTKVAETTIVVQTNVPPPDPIVPSNAYLAEYFSNKTLTAPTVSTATVATVGADWGLGGPAGLPVDGFSVRYRGKWTFEATTYIFTVRADDGVRLYVDGTLLIDKWIDQAATTFTAEKTLTAGEHEIKVEYYEAGGQAILSFSWAVKTDPDPTPGPMPVGGDPSIRGPQPFTYTTPDATVSGTSITALETARNQAGVNGTVFVPAGTYPTLPLTVAGQKWQLENGAIVTGQILPKERGITIEGGELRGGIWLGISTNAHDFKVQHIKFRQNGIANESRSGLSVRHCDFQQIAAEAVRLWYDNSLHLDVQGLTIENNYYVRTSYAVNGVAAFSGGDGGGAHKLYDAVLRNNYVDNGADVGQGPGGLGAFGGFEIWGIVRQINEYNEMKGGGFLNSNVRSQDGEVRFNRWFIGVGKAWACYESGGTGTGGDKIHDNEAIGEAAKNGVLIAVATPNPIRTVEVYNNKYRDIRLTSDTSAPGYNFHDNVTF